MKTSSAEDSGVETAPWSLRLLGDFELTELAGGEKVTVPGKRERVLLAYLALSPNGRVSRRKLTTLLWGDASDETTLDNLRTAIFNLRKALGDGEHRVISSDGRDVVLDVAAFEIDVLRFRLATAESGTAELQAAANLWRGEFLEGLGIDSEEFESWRREEGTRCKDRAIDVLTWLMMELAGSGETAPAIEAGLRIRRIEPLHEATARRLMRIYADSGRRKAAIELYHTLAGVLHSELNTQPEAETRALFAEISRGNGQTSVAVSVESAEAPVPVAADEQRAAIPGLQPSSRATRPDASDELKRPTLKFRVAVAALAAVVIATVMALYPQLMHFGLRSAAVAEASVSPSGAISIAVLPFANMSGDTSQDFFAEGMTEEITTALAKIPNLRVVARTSAFQFKSENKDLRDVGAALGATHLIEGSVRKDGQRLRIAAQLIKADDGTHLWAETYDREFSDVFAVQEDIAQAIAGALRTRLGVKPGERLITSRDIDAESYQQFLRARPLIRARIDGVEQATKILEPVVARNPDYAPALALLAVSHSFIDTPNRGATVIKELLLKAEVEARRAIQSDPNLADGYLALARIQRLRGKLIEAEDLLLKAIALDPSNPDVLDLYMLHLSNIGRLEEALALSQKLRALEPYVPGFNADIGEILWENGQSQPAIDTLTPLIGFGSVRVNLAMMYASVGRHAESAELLESDAALAPVPQEFREERRRAAEILRAAPDTPVARQSLAPFLSAVHLDFVYLYAGAPERVLESYENAIKVGQVGGEGGTFAFLWQPSYAPVRKTDRFKIFVRNAGFVDYWRAKGWPKFCRPTTADDFVCV